MRVLIYFNGFTDVIGGSEFLPLTLAHEFQKQGHDVTLALCYASDLDRARHQYGVPLDIGALTIARLDAENRLELLINRLFRCLREWKLQRLARSYDICISTVNPIDFGRPAIHFIYMLGFTPGFRRALGWVEPPQGGGQTAFHKLWRRFTAALADKFIVHMRTPDEILQDHRERVYPNSKWAKDQIEAYFKCTTCPAFYPPTLFEPQNLTDEERGNIVVSIGRIDPLKRIDFQIAIVEEVRRRTGVDLRFVIAGHVKDDDYGCRIMRMAAARGWVKLVGVIYGNDKSRLLTSARFALHTTTCEAFGISVVEYIKYGIISIVPNTGGAAEIVSAPQLQYNDFDDAVMKLSAVVTDVNAYESAKRICIERAKVFSSVRYWERQGALVTSLRKG